MAFNTGPSVSESMRTEVAVDLIKGCAKAGYDSYAKATGNKSLATGDDLPEWAYLPQAIRDAWQQSAEGMIAFLAQASEHVVEMEVVLHGLEAEEASGGIVTK